jgi:hypothetical protein
MPMNKLFQMLVFAFSLALAACASTKPQPDCSLSGQELEQMKAGAMAYLLSEWPMDEQCQQISDVVIASDPGKCAIFGEPRVSANCPQTSYLGYSIVFDQDTKEFERVHFKTE